MAVTRADGEAKAPIKVRRTIEIAHCMNDVVEPARHRE
jgi:hypothetical protein